jgi:SPP1 gp7 family putative phage head morphogenesis protein
MPAKPREPRAIELAYVKAMLKIWRRAQGIVSEGLEPVFEAWPDRMDSLIRADEERVIRARMLWIQEKLQDLINSGFVSATIQRLSRRVDRWSKMDLERVMGIDLSKSDPLIRMHLNIWVQENVSLITTAMLPGDTTRIRPSMLDDIGETVLEAWRSGQRVEVLRDTIRERFQVSNSRASFIARDQVLSLNGQITQKRQTTAGISFYDWDTSRDEKVRPYHRRLHGTRQRWDRPPEVAPGRHAHPGGDYGCRCLAIPVME